MKKISLVLLTLALTHCQANSMESPLADLKKTLKRAERVTFALKVLNYGLVGLIGWNLGSFAAQFDDKKVISQQIEVEKSKRAAYEEGRKEGFLEGKCNKERILWNYWRRTDYGNLHGFSHQESQKWQAQREKAGQAYFDCRKQSEELANKI